MKAHPLNSISLLIKAQLLPESAQLGLSEIEFTIYLPSLRLSRILRFLTSLAAEYPKESQCIRHMGTICGGGDCRRMLSHAPIYLRHVKSRVAKLWRTTVKKQDGVYLQSNHDEVFIRCEGAVALNFYKRRSFAFIRLPIGTSYVRFLHVLRIIENWTVLSICRF